MAWVVCEHCQAPVHRHEKKMLNGFSYHEKCHKCYVCSETNLQNAEVFKGVIFCSSCSQRIFQGCATARRAKNTARRTRDRSHKRRSHRTRGKKSIPPPQNGILAMTGLAVSTDTSKSCCDASNGSRHSEPFANTISTDMALIVGKPMYERVKTIKRSSVEMGMTTDVTHQLLKQMHCPVVHDSNNYTKVIKPAPKSPPVQKRSPCSDPRVAELGTSREMANMVLKHKSEQPVIIKSTSPTKTTTPTSPSESINKNSESGERSEDWMDSAYSTLKNSTKSNWMDRRLGSLLKLPYFAFKRNILDKNSVISVIMKTENKAQLLQKIKVTFKQEVTEHQKRGLRRLYSTINRKQNPRKLGWLKLVANVNGSTDNILRLYHGSHYQKRCKHFRESHSYRCMRTQAMRLAGPTKSELAMFRNKVKNLIAPGFLRIQAIKDCTPAAIKATHACGSSKAESSTIK